MAPAARVFSWRGTLWRVVVDVLQNELLQTIYDVSPDAIIVIDAKGLIRSFSHMAEFVFGHLAVDVIGQNVKMLMPPYFADNHDGYLWRYLRTGERHIIGIGRVVTGLRKDGSTFPLELAIGEARVGGEPYFTGFVRDLTERQQTEQRIHELQDELIHSSRLASLGEVSSMVAHEANQPLSAAATYLEVAREMLASSEIKTRERGTQTLEQVALQIRRVGETIRRIREFAKNKTPEQAAENINRIVEEAAAIAAIGTKGKGIRTDYDLAADLPPVFVDRIQIQQVVVNLVRNSIDAMEKAARRDLTLRTRPLGEGLIEVSVIDSGFGIPSGQVERLFMPFATTKKDGTGLGLAICRSIVEAHGGILHYLPNLEGGAIFKFNVPVSTKKRS